MKYLDTKVMVAVLVALVVFKYVIDKALGSLFAKASSYIPSL